MTVVRVPSAAVPASPAFEVDLADGWTVEPAPGAVAALSPPGGRGWSVVISSTRVAADDDLRAVAVRSFARQRAQHRTATIRSQRTGRFGDRLTYLREVSLPDTDRGSFAQLHALFFAPAVGAGPVRDVFSVVASCPDGQLGELGPAVVDLVASWRFVE